MEVKSIYLDLQKAELTKKGKKSVWKLESEAFKEPLELTIGYDDEDKSYIENIKKEIEKKSESYDRKIADLNGKLEEEEKILKAYDDTLCKYEDLIEEYEKKIESQTSEISQLYKVIADAKTIIETQSGAILHLWDRVKELEKKATKQPMVFSDKTFISGHERCGLSMIEIPSGEYLVISKYVIWECNEFVTNQNDVTFEKITVNDNCYVPMYQLVGWTDLDTPTATIYRTLTFIPC